MQHKRTDTHKEVSVVCMRVVKPKWRMSAWQRKHSSIMLDLREAMEGKRADTHSLSADTDVRGWGGAVDRRKAKEAKIAPCAGIV